MPEEASRQEPTLRSMVEGRKTDHRAEQCAESAEICWLCGTRSNGTMRQVGGRPVCIDCYRQVREVAINIDAREVEARNERKH